MTVHLHKSYVSSPGANLAATVTLAAPGAGKRYLLWQILYSYSATPTGGNLTVTAGGATVLELDISGAGPGAVSFETGAWVDPNAALVVTLAAGSTSVLGKVNVQASIE